MFRPIPVLIAISVLPALLIIGIMLVQEPAPQDTPSKTIEGAYADAEEPVDIDAIENCLSEDACEDKAAAQFALAAEILSTSPQTRCRWANTETGALVPIALSPAADKESQPPETSDAGLGSDGFEITLDSGSIFNPYDYQCDYDNQASDFQEGYALMKAAYAGGHPDAANELAQLHIDDPDLHDLAYARAILEPCHAYGDGYCAFNLARIESLEADDGCGRCLILLRVAAARTSDLGMRFFYAQAKKRLGRGDIKGDVFFKQDANKGTQSYLMEFETQFPRLAR